MHLSEEVALLEAEIGEISKKAAEHGLDFYDMHFEICPADILYTFGAYGMPTRFSHWTFGKAYHKMKTQYDYNLSRIYEMVINSDPCHAFLLEGNTMIQNKLVIAHVIGHCDFFKNNAYFRKTNRSMVESMAVAAGRIREYEFKYGKGKVESFLDAVIAIEEHIDPYQYTGKKSIAGVSPAVDARQTPYDDLWFLDKKEEPRGEERRKFPVSPEKDLLLFILNHSRELEEWQKDVISIVRNEMLYFWPQMETKIINEGWATYWHLRIMREMDLTGGEALEFAKMHAGVIQPSRMQINPYLLGLLIFEDIERRWDNPTGEERERYGRLGGEGRKKIFEVRETENDVSFIRNYLTRELVEEMDLYLYKKTGYEWKITDKDWEAVRNGICSSMNYCGFPYLLVEDGDLNKRGELCLKHQYEGVEMDIYYLERTLPHVFRLWGRPVHLLTVLEGKEVAYTYNGEKCTRKLL